MEGPKSDFKWFGEGFDGFPRFLPEDCVEYTFYIIDPKLEESEIRAQLRAVQLTANDYIKKLLKNFIWQRQSFKLELIQDKGKTISYVE